MIQAANNQVLLAELADAAPMRTGTARFRLHRSLVYRDGSVLVGGRLRRRERSHQAAMIHFSGQRMLSPV